MRAVFVRPNKAVSENAAYDIVYSTYMAPRRDGKEPVYKFLKFHKNLETDICLENWDTPVIIWRAVTERYYKIMVAKLHGEREGRKLHPVKMFLTRRVTIQIGDRRLMRCPLDDFTFSDITLRNISRVAENIEEHYYENGDPVRPVAPRPSDAEGGRLRPPARRAERIASPEA